MATNHTPDGADESKRGFLKRFGLGAAVLATGSVALPGCKPTEVDPSTQPQTMQPTADEEMAKKVAALTGTLGLTIDPKLNAVIDPNTDADTLILTISALNAANGISGALLAKSPYKHVFLRFDDLHSAAAFQLAVPEGMTCDISARHLVIDQAPPKTPLGLTGTGAGSVHVSESVMAGEYRKAPGALVGTDRQPPKDPADPKKEKDTSELTITAMHGEVALAGAGTETIRNEAKNLFLKIESPIQRVHLEGEAAGVIAIPAQPDGNNALIEATLPAKSAFFGRPPEKTPQPARYVIHSLGASSDLDIAGVAGTASTLEFRNGGIGEKSIVTTLATNVSSKDADIGNSVSLNVSGGGLTLESPQIGNDVTAQVTSDATSRKISIISRDIGNSLHLTGTRAGVSVQSGSIGDGLNITAQNDSAVTADTIGSGSHALISAGSFAVAADTVGTGADWATNGVPNANPANVKKMSLLGKNPGTESSLGANAKLTATLADLTLNVDKVDANPIIRVETGDAELCHPLFAGGLDFRLNARSPNNVLRFNTIESQPKQSKIVTNTAVSIDRIDHVSLDVAGNIEIGTDMGRSMLLTRGVGKNIKIQHASENEPSTYHAVDANQTHPIIVQVDADHPLPPGNVYQAGAVGSAKPIPAEKVAGIFTHESSMCFVKPKSFQEHLARPEISGRGAVLA